MKKKFEIFFVLVLVLFFSWILIHQFSKEMEGYKSHIYLRPAKVLGKYVYDPDEITNLLYEKEFYRSKLKLTCFKENNLDKNLYINFTRHLDLYFIQYSNGTNEKVSIDCLNMIVDSIKDYEKNRFIFLRKTNIDKLEFLKNKLDFLNSSTNDNENIYYKSLQFDIEKERKEIQIGLNDSNTYQTINETGITTNKKNTREWIFMTGFLIFILSLFTYIAFRKK
jgi:hypothetical protein